MSIDPDFWAGRRVLITGHTGFKGAWLSLWLQAMGAQVSGIAPGSPTDPSLYAAAQTGSEMAEYAIDVRDGDAVRSAFAKARPEVVMHLAAQPMVRRSYLQPVLTYEVNVMGTVNVLEAVRATDNVRSVVVVTSDKCYDNHGDVVRQEAFTESDAMGGSDPYSSSKGCAELVTAAYRASYFAAADAPRVASARAGNVIGGGDWGEDRLIADVVRSAQSGQTLTLRNPDAIRPWQHVLNPLAGYLTLAQALHRSPQAVGAWNFGPAPEDARPVRWIVDRLGELWPSLDWRVDEQSNPPEASYLMLDSGKAFEHLGWSPSWDLQTALAKIVQWHDQYREGAQMRPVSIQQIKEFMQHRLPYRSAGHPSPDPAAWVDHNDSTPEDSLA